MARTRWVALGRVSGATSDGVRTTAPCGPTGPGAAVRHTGPMVQPGPDPDSLPPIDPDEPVPDDPGELSPDTPETLPPAPIEPTPGPDDPGNVPGTEPEPEPV